MRLCLLVVLTAAYLAALVDLTLVRFPQRDPTPNLIPLRTIISCLDDGRRSIMVNLVGNLLLLAPVGPLLGLIRRGRGGLAEAVLAGLLFSLAIESAQFAGGHRMADIDDVLLNTLGVLIGYSVFRVFERRPSPIKRARPSTPPSTLSIPGA